MTTAEAVKILEAAAKDRNLPMLEFLGEVSLWTDEYSLSIQDAYHVFMRAGRQMFAPV
jgi:UDP-N-acetyl-D-mannosaminuronate dehydrogenase